MPVTKKNATIIIAAEDELQSPIYKREIIDAILEPDQKNIICQAQIPRWAALGNASVTASAYTALPALGRVPYCLSQSGAFEITLHDLAITRVVTSTTIAYIGELVDINVTIKNEGAETENSSVTGYHNFSSIGPSPISEIFPKAKTILTFTWNTSGLDEGDYTTKAWVPPVYGEENIQDNELVDGTIRVILRPSGPSPRPLLIWVILLLTILFATILVIVYLRRKKKKRAESFITGVVNLL